MNNFIRNNDFTILCILIFGFIVVSLLSVWVDKDITRLEEQYQLLIERDAIQTARVSQLYSWYEDHEERVGRVEIVTGYHQERLDYLSDSLSELRSNCSTRFNDILHEVGGFEEALEDLSMVDIKLPTTWTGPKLSRTSGVVQGPSGRETYYNMDMTYCINRMRSKGYSAKDYPSWVRDDGCKMLGPYVMVAANFNIRPLGTILETSRGWGIVVDTGGFVKQFPKGLDIATNW